jgi:hypothetical protein
VRFAAALGCAVPPSPRSPASTTATPTRPRTTSSASTTGPSAWAARRAARRPPHRPRPLPPRGGRRAAHPPDLRRPQPRRPRPRRRAAGRAGHRPRPALGRRGARLPRGGARARAGARRQRRDPRGGAHARRRQRLAAAPGEPLGTKVEVKNLNSFKSVQAAIESETLRQTRLLDAGPGSQETRGWNEGGQKSYVLRTKEEAADYRYLDDPDLPRSRLDAPGSPPCAPPPPRRRRRCAAATAPPGSSPTTPTGWPPTSTSRARSTRSSPPAARHGRGHAARAAVARQLAARRGRRLGHAAADGRAALRPARAGSRAATWPPWSPSPTRARSADRPPRRSCPRCWRAATPVALVVEARGLRQVSDADALARLGRRGHRGAPRRRRRRARTAQGGELPDGPGDAGQPRPGAARRGAGPAARAWGSETHELAAFPAHPRLDDGRAARPRPRARPAPAPSEVGDDGALAALVADHPVFGPALAYRSAASEIAERSLRDAEDDLARAGSAPHGRTRLATHRRLARRRLAPTRSTSRPPPGAASSPPPSAGAPTPRRRARRHRRAPGGRRARRAPQPRPARRALAPHRAAAGALVALTLAEDAAATRAATLATRSASTSTPRRGARRAGAAHAARLAAGRGARRRGGRAGRRATWPRPAPGGRAGFDPRSAADRHRERLRRCRSRGGGCGCRTPTRSPPRRSRRAALDLAAPRRPPSVRVGGVLDDLRLEVNRVEPDARLRASVRLDGGRPAAALDLSVRPAARASWTVALSAVLRVDDTFLRDLARRRGGGRRRGRGVGRRRRRGPWR